MKSHHIIIVIVIAAFALIKCTPKQNFDLKVTIVPASETYVTTLNDMNAAAEVICTRLNNAFGIPKENIKTEVTGNKIFLTVMKAESGKTAAIRQVISDHARLELRETYENSELTGDLSKANDLLKKSDADIALFDILKPRVTMEGEPIRDCMIGLAAAKDTATVRRYLLQPEIRKLFPPDLLLMWSHKPYKYYPSQNLFELHALKMNVPGKAPIDGSVIVSARAVKGRSESDIKIDLGMNAQGREKWAEITRNNIGRCIAVVIDGQVRSYPRVQSEISGGNTEITGDFTFEEANDLVNIFKSGQLPFELRIADEQVQK